VEEREGGAVAAISIGPLDALLDQPIGINVSGLAPGARVELRLRNHRLKAQAIAVFEASDAGTVDVATRAPVEGDYEGIAPAGLFWAARFDAGADAATMLTALSSLDPLTYTASAVVDGVEVATFAFARRLLSPQVQSTAVRDGRLRGTLCTPIDTRNAPGVVVLGGSDGGDLYRFVAALLAAHGIVAMSLAYFGFDDLPKDLIRLPVEYFGEAVAWLRRRAEVGTSRVGILGFSRGAEAALLTATTFPDVAAAVALMPGTLTGGGISGTDFTAMAKPAWTIGDNALPLIAPPWDPVSMKEVHEAFTKGTPLAAKGGMLRALESAGPAVDDVVIRVEQIRGPILLMSGEDDQLWPSTRFAELAEQRLAAAQFPHAYEHLRYPGAGHFACLPPNLPAATAVARHPLVPMSFAFGGTPRGNSAAGEDLWPRIVTFLQRHLSPAA
jgi:dienelactone hydrolase